MDDREKLIVEREARVRAGDPRRTDARAQAVNRYLSAVHHLDAHPRPERPAERHVKDQDRRTTADRP